MKTLHPTVAVCGLLLASFASRPAWADVFNMGGTRNPVTGQWTGQASLEFVTVGDPGNSPDTIVMVDGTTGYGGVAYSYQIGKYDVTARQYCEFLNSVATTADPYALYDAAMSNTSHVYPTYYAGCGITRSGSPGAYRYDVIAGRDNYPVNHVTWADAVRFTNWLSNGQPAGSVEGPGTTETGSYTLNGAMEFYELMAIARNPGATYVLPTVDEWHKAAFYKGGSTNAGYWLYPTRSDSVPSNVLSSTGANNANFWAGNYTDPVNLLTPVGRFAGTPGPYGTFDMGGDVCQWNETASLGSSRGLRGGPFYHDYDPFGYTMRSSFNGHAFATDTGSGWGFRVALVPEPATLSLLALGGMLLARRRRA